MRSKLTVTVLATLLAGCGGSGDSLTYRPVSGTVMANGQPLADATVMFSPSPSAEHPNPGPASIATTDSSGKYALTTIRGEKGAVVGEHKVSISTEKVGDDSQGVLAKETVPAKYNASTELTFMVPAEGTDKADFDLEFTPPKAK